MKIAKLLLVISIFSVAIPAQDINDFYGKNFILDGFNIINYGIHSGECDWEHIKDNAIRGPVFRLQTFSKYESESIILLKNFDHAVRPCLQRHQSFNTIIISSSIYYDENVDVIIGFASPENPASNGAEGPLRLSSYEHREFNCKLTDQYPTIMQFFSIIVWRKKEKIATCTDPASGSWIRIKLVTGFLLED